MTPGPTPETDRSPLKRALIALERMQSKIDSLEQARHQPIAIIGMGCRFPKGVQTADQFWRFLREGGNAISEVPADRWDLNAHYSADPDAPGKTYSRWGGFLDGVDQFDPQFFGITPREAASMDPQQRLLLEVTWEALENAGQAPDGLRNSRTGVFTGILSSDYGDLQLASSGIERVDAYFGSGTARSMASGRLSYFLGLRGPSLSIDTACSSSLVAVHLACQSLRSGETRMAIAAGVNLTLMPEPTVALSRFRMMSPDGRCKSFDRDADGYVRGEACGVLILKPLAAALADGDTIHAVIRGAAVNQDGASSGLTVPNGPAQEAVICEALADGGIDPNQVTYVEAHGTGTALGDPIEIHAVAAALGLNRPADRPIIVGTVKANIGHTEAAAGVSGIIKAVLCLRHREIPRQMCFENPNPFIPWDRLPITIPRATMAWPDGAPPIAGVSSFGFSGTNAHVLIESAPAPVMPAGHAKREYDLLTLSAASAGGLRATAERYVDYLEDRTAASWADVCHTANTGRARLPHRLTILARDNEEGRARLEHFVSNRPVEGIAQRCVPKSEPPSLAFFFPEQRTAYPQAGREFYGGEPVFREALVRCAAFLRTATGEDLLAQLHGIGGSTCMTEAALYSLECALADLWRSWGIRPAAVLGEGVGEYAAAYVAGIYTLEEGLSLAVALNVGRIQPRPAQLRVISNATASSAPQDINLLLELGPGAWMGADPGPVATMREGKDYCQQALEALSQLYLSGIPVDWSAVDRHYPRRRVSLPATAFERSRHWVREAPPVGRQFAPQAPESTLHPLLHRRLESPIDGEQFESLLTASRIPYLEDHRVRGTSILPATAFLEIAIAGATRAMGTNAVAVGEMAIRTPLSFHGDDLRTVQLILSPPENQGRQFRIFSLSPNGEKAWTLHAEGSIVRALRAPDGAAVSLDDIRARCVETVDSAGHYAELARRGFDFGPSLQGVRRIWRREGEALALIELPEPSREGSGRYHFPPNLADACLQQCWVLLPDADGSVYLPMSLARFQIHAEPPARVWSHATARRTDCGGAPAFEVDVRIFDEDGQWIAEFSGLRFRRAGHPKLVDWLYELRWDASSFPPAVNRISLASTQLAVDRDLESLAMKHGLARHREFAARLETVSLAYVTQALQTLGIRFRAGLRLSIEELVSCTKILPKYRRLLLRMMQMFKEEAVLRRDGQDWVVERQPSLADPEVLCQKIASDFSQSTVQLELVRRCGRRLADALTGAADPLALLFPGGSLDQAEQFYREMPEARVFNALTAQAVADVVRQFPSDRPLRIIEFGAGTGGVTSCILPLLPAGRTEYFFTDVSPTFLSRARVKLKAFPFVRYEIFNAERPGREQGFVAGSFDVAIAANALHATADMLRTMSNVREMLAPHGALVLLEGTGSERWIDITFGLTDGWWAFSDTVRRPDYPLLSRQSWPLLLKDAGFADTMVGPARSDWSNQAVVVASAANEGRAQGAGWLLLTDDSASGNALAESLRHRGETCHTSSEWSTTEASEIHSVVYLAGLHAESPGIDPPESLEPVERSICGGLLRVIQTMASLPTGKAPRRLFVVTRGAQATGRESAISVAPAALLGFCKVVELEYPELKCVRLDLDPDRPVTDQMDLVAADLLARDGETQIAYRAGERLVARLVHAGSPSPYSPAVPDVALALRTPTSGILEELTWQSIERSLPGPDEVEIQVHASGLAFHDVLNALAIGPDAEPLGAECSGIVAAVGANVNHIRIGDEVVALATGALASHVIASAALVLPKPRTLSFEEAATLPTAAVTAYYALSTLADLRAGEHVLIHAAAGGVGLMAVQLARRIGAIVIATAGSRPKREFLRSLGVAHIFSSRTTEFADSVRRLTNGRGVDVVLNSLSGDLIRASLDAMAENGRFLELGKRGIWSSAEMLEAKPGARYALVDLSRVGPASTATVAAAYSAVMSLVEAGELQPLPLRIRPWHDVAAAFQEMAHARHIGKIVITQPAGQHPGRVRPDASYLVTGGFNGLGLLTAEWLVEQGARHIVLMGRSDLSDLARQAVERMEARGTRVVVERGSVADADRTREVIDHIARTLPPLRGVIHSAGVLEDGVLARQEWGRFQRVMAPKIDGAWNLHALTINKPLDFFVLFSSAAGVLGSPGQANHAAANAFLDALAHERRARGWPAVSIDWGIWSDLGSAAERGAGERVRQQGVSTIAPAQGLELLGMLLNHARPQVAVLPVDWVQYLRQFGDAAPVWLSELSRSIPTAAAPRESAAPKPVSATWRTRLEATPQGERRPLMEEYVSEQVAAVIGIDPMRPLDPKRALNELGFDSLMAVELRNRLGRALALDGGLPVTLVFDYPSIGAIAGYLEKQFGGEETSKSRAGGAAPDDVLAVIEQLSDEEAQKLLSRQG